MTRSAWILAVFLAIALAVGGVVLVRAESAAPRIDAPEAIFLGKGPRKVEFDLSDEGSGLRGVKVGIDHAAGHVALADRRYAGNPASGGGPASEHVEISIDAEALGLPQGDAFLEVEARDWSWRGWLMGNTTTVRVPLSVDLRAPRIVLETGLTYVRRGGAAVVVYRVNEPTARDGVEVGERFYAGRAWPAGCTDAADGCRAALFAVPIDAPEDPKIRVLAEDRAGNVKSARFDARVQARAIPKAPIRLSENFLQNKVMDLAEAWNLDATDALAAFKEINEKRRARDEARIQELVATSADEPLWDGPFEQLANSKVTSLFAERRVYSFQGKEVSRASHYGYDLASTSRAPVTASNSGRVLFAGPLGIYGDCILVDHGMGVVSLYGHLSHMEVEPGDAVERGQQMGRTGSTGFAGGDHLHFAILVGGTYVDPREWWDARWLRDHVTVRLRPKPPEAPAGAG
jgi:murein DD-endopeptidase MepM/ murein hydrolase activator NlpD